LLIRIIFNLSNNIIIPFVNCWLKHIFWMRVNSIMVLRKKLLTLKRKNTKVDGKCVPSALRLKRFGSYNFLPKRFYRAFGFLLKAWEIRRQYQLWRDQVIQKTFTITFVAFYIKLLLSLLQWAPLNRITLGHEQFDSNIRIWVFDTIIRILSFNLASFTIWSQFIIMQSTGW
jgi:hypothetical protein